MTEDEVPLAKAGLKTRTTTASKPGKKVFKEETTVVEDDSFLGTPEEIAQDNAEWDAIISNTPPEKLAKLNRMFDEQLKRGGFTPLDFTDK